MAQNNQPQAEPVEQTVSGFEAFIKRYGRILGWCIVAALATVIAILAYNRLIVNPARENARGAMFPAEKAFMEGNYQVALDGDGVNMGLAEVIEEFGSRADASAFYYAGVAALQLNRNEEALEYLKKYKGKDPVINGRALCCIGDALVNLDRNAEAIQWYNKAAAAAENSFRSLYLMKAATIHEVQGNTAEALKLYEEIKTKYPRSMEADQAVKCISRIENK